MSCEDDIFWKGPCVEVRAAHFENRANELLKTRKVARDQTFASAVRHAPNCGADIFQNSIKQTIENKKSDL